MFYLEDSTRNIDIFLSRYNMQLETCSSKEENFMRGDLYERNDIKPVFSGHETFPLRYGWLKKVYDEVYNAELKGKDAKDIFNDPESICLFGVGKNMVSSMKHWASFAGVIDDNKTTDDFAHFLKEKGLDPWMENPTTLWYIHFNLVKNTNLVTYHWFFNYYNGGVFERKTINDEIIELCRQKGWKIPSPVTIKRDVGCLIRTYVNKDTDHNNFDDDTIESPLAELSLIKPVNKHGYFVPNWGAKNSLKTSIFVYSLIDFWINNFNNSSTLSIESILYDPCSPGRIFLLDEEAVLEKAVQVENLLSGEISWSETAGMQQFIKRNNIDLIKIRDLARQLIEKEYLPQ